MRNILSLLAVVPLFFGWAPAALADPSLADDVLAEINVARKSPATYISYLHQARKAFRGRKFKPPGSRFPVVTVEGVKAVDEAIAALSRQKPLPPLSVSDWLRRAAEDLVTDEGKSGQVGHDGGSSGDMRERIERHGTWSGRIGENISYGPSNARWVVLALIIDDGVDDRGHRKNIFDRAFRTAGVACGSHARFRTMCVIDFATRMHQR